MHNNQNLYLLMQEDENYLLPNDGEMQSFCDKQKSRYQDSSYLSSVIGKSNSKVGRTLNKRNHNQQLQDLLQTQTINYGNTSNLSAQKKRLFTDLSFLSKDCTQDHTNEEGYSELMNKIHFQRSRNRQLNHELAQQKQRLIQKYLQDLLQQFNELSEQNKHLRQVYKKQAGGGFKQKLQRNQSMKQQQIQKNNQLLSQYQTQSQTPRNAPKTGRKSIAGGSVAGSQQPNYTSLRPSVVKQKSFIGIGNQNFCQTKKMQNMMRQTNKMQYCESSININNGQSLVPSPKRHKRRQSQLTERKDYPVNQNMGNDFLLIMDNQSEASFENGMTGRMSQPGKMPKQRYAQEVGEQQSMKNSSHWAKAIKNENTQQFGLTIQKNSLRLSLNQSQVIPAPTNTKNIFIQFLQTLLIQERISYTEMAQEINQTTAQQEQNIMIPSYNNIKSIQQLEKQIMTKNLKLRQLQQVINVFKSQIQQIMGTDIKIINELMIQLLQVKGKFLEMQQKVNGITGLKRQVQTKQKIKQDILISIKERIQKRKKQAQLKNQPIQQLQQNFQIFPIPHSIKTLFDLLNIKMPNHSKPIDYLNEVKELPKNKQLFQAFDQKKRAACNMKIKQVIDQIREGRKKFNELIKIYEGRIVKLQQKLQKYKNQKHHGTQQK